MAVLEDGEIVGPRGDTSEPNTRSQQQRPDNHDGKSDAASNFCTSKPMFVFPTVNSPYPPTPAFGSPSFSGCFPSLGPADKSVKQERPTPTRNSSTADKSSGEDDQPPAKRMKLDFTDTIRIDVGPQRHAFHVPRKVATSRSTLLATNFKEGQAIFLPGEDVQVFSIWLQILYQGQVVVDDEDNTLDKAHVWSLLVKTYILSTQLGDVQSTNITTDEIVRRLRYRAFGGDEPIAQAVKYTFEHTSPDSKLRRVFVDYAVYRASDRNLFSETGSQDFLSEVAKEYMNWRDHTPTGPFGGRKGKFGEDVRQYHIKN
ncbi:hypothetical protein PRZ48_015138 [Zasmidium cellare]|uniref:BTB domain-containing protein n=1 Tax=Zasmidium cellare TaxID=395010 RepID=A0ABR0DXR5_ZASCE|nr:hypothetical protein PRZ48_015138 [Zasmidium cellare]